MADFTLRPFQSDDVPWLVDAHATHYARNDGFDDTFGPLVNTILTDFVASHDPDVERGWIAEVAGERAGSIFCVRLNATTAKLRLFYLSPRLRGQGAGKVLLRTCCAFARDVGYDQMTLWTHESHRAAGHLYKTHGFDLVDARPVHSFGQDLIEQTWTKRL